ncbi:MAG TPA: sigma-54 dependent transcriptional regulator, partial [Clostridia bacterium]|nr:sigma-54 dependent transcriptional regulator [Clostridia bacterium]
PDVDGIELLKAIKALDSSIAVILITAFATLETAVEALKMGARDYITKPFDLEEIYAAISRIAGDGKEELEADLLVVNEQSANNYLTAKSAVMQHLLKLLNQVAGSNATVMLYGETGTGKEIASKTIHDLSGRRDKPFIKVNCAAIPDALLESELFGYEKGAFTGAATRKPGRFELAERGSIFLDEIGDMPLSVQAKLLRVLQEREFERLGGIKTIKVDVRIIAATNKNLASLVKQGTFREDLYYRLNVVPIEIPPLRERKEDVPTLVEHFLFKASSISGNTPKKISDGAMEALVNYNWPGNIRELENIIERCVVVTSGNLITLEDLPEYIAGYGTEGTDCPAKANTLDETVDNAEKSAIVKILQECGGNRTHASEKLGISRRSLHRKIIKYNIED